jgi:hypothetical protein
MTRSIHVEILYFDGCPSFEALLPRVREIVAEHGGDPHGITLRAVESLGAAEAARFLGSPSVRVDGRDIDATAAERDDFGLKCRLYPSEDGQAPVPPDGWIRAALAASPQSTEQ